MLQQHATYAGAERAQQQQQSHNTTTAATQQLTAAATQQLTQDAQCNKQCRQQCKLTADHSPLSTSSTFTPQLSPALHSTALHSTPQHLHTAHLHSNTQLHNPHGLGVELAQHMQQEHLAQLTLQFTQQTWTAELLQAYTQDAYFPTQALQDGYLLGADRLWRKQGALVSPKG